ncbi:MAG: acetyl-CoA carboxylase biotin carboxyl carrier protein subunit [Chlorobi bacterium]|nr:acetyl-CoA carboxylase biotin carboxyl carrier protein subunit [Chlorobiota bacterium]
MYSVKVGDKNFKVEFEKNSTSKGKINGKDFTLDIIETNTDIYHLIMNDESFHIEVLNIDYDSKKVDIKIRNNKYSLELRDELDELLQQMGMGDLNKVKINELKAPMPGMVLNIMVEEGTNVEKGDSLLVLEAMKMENNIKSPTDGVIKKVSCEKGRAVEKNEVMIVFE